MRTIFILLSALCILPSAFAVKTERWEIATAQDFLRGKLDRVIVSGDGGLRLGYGSARLGEFAKEVWCSAVAGDGTIYFGTGSPADVYAVGKDGQASRLFQTEAIAVTALAVDSRGNVYAGTLADGKIYKIPAGKKEGAEFCRLKAPYIWSLVFDQADRLYAATGPDGKIYRIAPDGKAEEWFAAEESSLLCLAFDADGSLLAGGSDRGLLYRVTDKGKGTVLHEFAEDEVKAIVVRDGEMFIGANKQKVRRPRAAAGRRPSAAEFEDLTQRLTAQYGMGAPTETGGRGRETPPEARLANLLAGALYKRNADGRVDLLNSWDNEAIMALALDAAGNILVGAAGQGRVYRLRSAGGQPWDLLFDFDEQQALTLATRDGRLAFVGTGNIGNGYLIESQPAADGEYTSEVHDGKFLTTWGNLTWRGTGSIAVATRSGNTALPDKTWSDWSAPLTASPGKVASPRARFIQLRVQLSRASDPVLQSLSLYSRSQNQKPEVQSITVGESPKPTPEKPKPDAEQKSDATEEPPKKIEDTPPKPASPVKNIRWRADAKDGDTLVYRLYYRAEDDEVWMPMPLEKPLRKTEYAWNTESVADGWYRIKVVASDEESNPPGEALTDEKISDPVKVDNRRPEIVELAFANGTLSGIARDNLSLIRNLEYSVDGGEWKFFSPKDGVFDDRQEPFAVKLDPLSPGPHTLAVRATDEEGNIGVEKLSVRVAP